MVVDFLTDFLSFIVSRGDICSKYPSNSSPDDLYHNENHVLWKAITESIDLLRSVVDTL